MIYARVDTNFVLEKLSCKGCSFQAIPNMVTKEVLSVARIKNCNKLGLAPLLETTLVRVIIFAGVRQNKSSVTKVYTQVVAKKK
jgi:hypothetical protein